jgi:hypothetical protein
VQRESNLLQIVFALRTPGRFPRLLNRWQQQGDQHADDGNHHQKLDQGKPTRSAMHDTPFRKN